jgi:hypothetical protein
MPVSENSLLELEQIYHFLKQVRTLAIVFCVARFISLFKSVFQFKVRIVV